MHHPDLRQHATYHLELIAKYIHVIRDVKPSNILINAVGGGKEDREERRTRLLIGDFSSAVSDDVLMRSFYGEEGPSVDEVRVLCHRAINMSV